MNSTDEVLKAIAKELHEMNKKLDRFGRASIFNLQSEVTTKRDEDVSEAE